MKSLFLNLLALLVRAAGGRPEVVLPLFQGLERAAEGRNELLRAQARRRRRINISAWALRAIMLTLTALGSVILTVFLLVHVTDFHPHPGVLVLAAAHWFLVLALVLNLAGPSLLVDEDFQVLGWWPVSRRELLLARLGTLLMPALQVSLALLAAPLVALAVTGRPPVLLALLFLAGLTVQTLGLVFGAGVVLSLVVRLWGRRRAQRVAALMADGNSLMYFWLILLFADKLVHFFADKVGLLLALPPFWFAGFGDLQGARSVWPGALAGTLVSLLMVWLGLRLLVSEGGGQAAEPLETRPSRWHYSSLISWLLQPMMPGREGWVVRRLLEHHLREDWRFIAGMVSLPVIMAFLFFGLTSTRGDHEITRSALLAVGNHHLLIFMASSIIFLSSYSSTPRAMWVVGLADLDTGRLLAAQRGMIRGLAFFPILAVYAVRAFSLGASWQVVALDVLVLGLETEAAVTILQPFLMIMPFSLAYTNEQTGRRILVGFLAMAVGLVFILGNFLYAENDTGHWVVLGALPLVLLGARVWHGWRVAGRRLNMDAVINA